MTNETNLPAVGNRHVPFVTRSFFFFQGTRVGTGGADDEDLGTARPPKGPIAPRTQAATVSYEGQTLYVPSSGSSPYWYSKTRTAPNLTTSSARIRARGNFSIISQLTRFLFVVRDHQGLSLSSCLFTRLGYPLCL